MRGLILLLLVVPLVTTAQRTFKFALSDADTGKPMIKKWITVLQNQNTYITLTPTDSAGICTFSVHNYDSTATYQAEITNRWSNHVVPGFYDITAVKTGIPVIKIKSLGTSMPFGCGEVFYPNYYAREPFSLQDLPEAIQRKINIYFLNRVGKRFHEKIVLNGGQLVNLDTFYKFNPTINRSKYIPSAYNLCFMVWDPVARQSLYTFQIEMDADGNLRKPIPLPDVVHEPAKAHILKLEEAKAIAKTKGFDKPWTQAKTYYYTKAKSIVWEFEQHDQGQGSFDSHQLLIDAHNGKVVDQLTSRVTVVY